MLDQDLSSINHDASPWPHAVRYGIIWALVGIIMQLVMYSTGMLETILASKAPASTSILITLAGILIAVFSIYKAIGDYRAARGGGISLGKAVGVGALTGLVYGAIFAVFSYIFYNFIFTGYGSFMESIMIEQWENAGMGEDEIEAALGMSGMFTSPMFAAIASVPAGVLYGTIISLIAGAFMKTE